MFMEASPSLVIAGAVRRAQSGTTYHDTSASMRPLMLNPRASGEAPTRSPTMYRTAPSPRAKGRSAIVTIVVTNPTRRRVLRPPQAMMWYEAGHMSSPTASTSDVMPQTLHSRAKGMRS